MLWREVDSVEPSCAQYDWVFGLLPCFDLRKLEAHAPAGACQESTLKTGLSAMIRLTVYLLLTNLLGLRSLVSSEASGRRHVLIDEHQEVVCGSGLLIERREVLIEGGN